MLIFVKMNVMTIDHYRDIGSYLSKSPKTTMASVIAVSWSVVAIVVSQSNNNKVVAIGWQNLTVTPSPSIPLPLFRLLLESQGQAFKCAFKLHKINYFFLIVPSQDLLMMTAFFFCFKDQNELGEGHEKYF